MPRCQQAGLCQAQGYCSFPDVTCDSEQRFGDHAGPLAGDCVPEAGDTEAQSTETQSTEAGDGSVTSDSGMTSTPATTDMPPDSDTETSMPPLDTSADDDSTGMNPDQNYGPCVASCSDPCFIDESMQYGVCAEDCRSGDECVPLFADGIRYETFCSLEARVTPGVCLVLCNELKDCPLDGECVSSLGAGLGVCMWPLGAQ